MARSSSKYRLKQSRLKKKSKLRKLIHKYKAIKEGKTKVTDTIANLARLAEKIKKRGRDVPEVSTKTG